MLDVNYIFPDRDFIIFGRAITVKYSLTKFGLTLSGKMLKNAFPRLILNYLDS